MCKDPRDTKDCGWSKGELRVTSSTEPLSVCFMKYHSQREGGGGGGGASRISWIKELLRFSLSPFNPPPRSRQVFFLVPQTDPTTLQSWQRCTDPCVSRRFLNSTSKQQRARGRTGWARCRCVYVFEGVWFMCVLGKAGVGGGGGAQSHQDNDHDSHPTDSPPAVLLSPCLRFGFGTHFEPPQWFQITAELPGFLIPGYAQGPSGFWLHGLVLLTGGQKRVDSPSTRLATRYIPRRAQISHLLYDQLTAKKSNLFLFMVLKQNCWLRCKCVVLIYRWTTCFHFLPLSR